MQLHISIQKNNYRLELKNSKDEKLVRLTDKHGPWGPGTLGPGAKSPWSTLVYIYIKSLDTNVCSYIYIYIYIQSFINMI